LIVTDTQKKLIKILRTDTLIELVKNCFFDDQYGYILDELLSQIELRNLKQKLTWAYSKRRKKNYDCN